MKAKQSPARTPRKAKSKAKANNGTANTTAIGSPFQVLGHGIKAAFEGDNLLLAIDCSIDAYNKAPLSSTQKMRLFGNSRGWQYLQHSHGVVQLQLNVGRKV